MAATIDSKNDMSSRIKYYARAIAPSFVYLVGKFLIRNKYVPNIISPKAFNEKVLCKMLFDRDPRLPVNADKLAVRGFIEKAGGAKYLPQLLAVWDRPEDIQIDATWGPHVVKSNHGSSQLCLVKEPAMADMAAIRRAAAGWVSENYGRVHKEWCYMPIKPRIFAEGWIGPAGATLTDYKFFCFDGVPKFMKIIRDITSTAESAYCDLGFNRINVSDTNNTLDLATFERPKNVDEMIDLAASLSKGFDFLRVDMYNIDGQIVIGELTNYPLAAGIKLSPFSSDLYLGSFWDVSKMTYLPFSKFRKRSR